MTKLENCLVLIASIPGLLGSAAQPVASPLGDASPGRFDGTWDATVSCSEVNEDGRKAKGYVLQFPVEMKDGALRGQHGSENVSGWLEARGPHRSGWQRPAHRAASVPAQVRQARLRLRVLALYSSGNRGYDTDSQP